MRRLRSSAQRRGTLGIALCGALLGTLFALVAFAPASWLAAAVASATGERVLLADARGSVWSGSALPVLTAGVGGRDASALPGRLQWTLAVDGLALALRATQACCINGELRARIAPGLGRVTITLPASSGALGQWPAAWLAGFGFPFNTLQLGGWISLATSGLVAESVAGRWHVAGNAALTVDHLSSRVSTLETLGSYRITIAGTDVAQIALVTQDGALRLSGNGQYGANGLRFRGEARAAPGFEAALDNLLNLIGRRQGPLAVISIG